MCTSPAWYRRYANLCTFLCILFVVLCIKRYETLVPVRRLPRLSCANRSVYRFTNIDLRVHDTQACCGKLSRIIDQSKQSATKLFLPQCGVLHPTTGFVLLARIRLPVYER
jgi:hypothetical protein